MDNLITLDACVPINHFRSTRRDNTFFCQLLQNYKCGISAVAMYEVFAGVKDEQLELWQAEFAKIVFMPVTLSIVMEARKVSLSLRRRNRLVPALDILIAATAIVENRPLATFNRKHFERIDGLELICPVDPNR